MVFGSCCFTCQGDQNSYGMRYIQLDIDDALLMGTLGVETLGVGTLGIGGSWAHHARGIGGSKGQVRSAVGGSKDGLFDVCRALYPTNLLHVSCPDVVSSLCSLDGKREESNIVSEN